MNSANFEARYDPVRQAPPPPTPDEALPQIEALPRPASSSREKVVNPEIAQTLAEIYQDNALAFAHAASASNVPYGESDVRNFLHVILQHEGETYNDQTVAARRLSSPT